VTFRRALLTAGLSVLAGCGPLPGTPPPESSFEVGVTGLKPVADEYVNGTAAYREHAGVHHLTGIAVRNEGYRNEARVFLHIAIRGVLEARSYSARPDTNLDDDMTAELTVIDAGFTSFRGRLAGGSLGLTEVSGARIEGGFILSFRDDHGRLVQAVGSLRAPRARGREASPAPAGCRSPRARSPSRCGSAAPRR
jgi:hypothetical protein